MIYTGRVQGVGFRYTAKSMAMGFAVSGYVRNQPDGTVELVVMGDSDEVAAFRKKLEERMEDNIRNISVQSCAAPDAAGFEIRA